jgi:hypothetical protein
VKAKEEKGLVGAQSWKNTLLEEAQIKKQEEIQLRYESITEKEN